MQIFPTGFAARVVNIPFSSGAPRRNGSSPDANVIEEDLTLRIQMLCWLISLFKLHTVQPEWHIHTHSIRYPPLLLWMPGCPSTQRSRADLSRGGAPTRWAGRRALAQRWCARCAGRQSLSDAAAALTCRSRAPRPRSVTSQVSRGAPLSGRIARAVCCERTLQPRALRASQRGEEAASVRL